MSDGDRYGRVGKLQKWIPPPVIADDKEWMSRYLSIGTIPNPHVYIMYILRKIYSSLVQYVVLFPFLSSSSLFFLYKKGLYIHLVLLTYVLQVEPCRVSREDINAPS